MKRTDLEKFFVVLYHRKRRGGGARKIEPIGEWLRVNQICAIARKLDDYIAIGLAASKSEADRLFDEFERQIRY